MAGIVVTTTDGGSHNFAESEADRWHVDELTHLHIINGSAKGSAGTVASFAAGKWVSVARVSVGEGRSGGGLVKFLLARIAEDEAMARQSSESGWAPGSGGLYWKDQDGGEIAIDPARLLAECEAKLLVVESYRELGGGDVDFPQANAFGVACLMLATAYADHPDYRDEWKP